MAHRLPESCGGLKQKAKERWYQLSYAARKKSSQHLALAKATYGGFKTLHALIRAPSETRTFETARRSIQGILYLARWCSNTLSASGYNAYTLRLQVISLSTFDNCSWKYPYCMGYKIVISVYEPLVFSILPSAY